MAPPYLPLLTWSGEPRHQALGFSYARGWFWHRPWACLNPAERRQSTLSCLARLCCVLPAALLCLLALQILVWGAEVSALPHSRDLIFFLQVTLKPRPYCRAPLGAFPRGSQVPLREVVAQMVPKPPWSELSHRWVPQGMCMHPSSPWLNKQLPLLPEQRGEPSFVHLACSLWWFPHQGEPRCQPISVNILRCLATIGAVRCRHQVFSLSTMWCYNFHYVETA